MPKTTSPVRNRTRETRDARVEAIVETATRLFSARGFRGTTVAAVAAEVGITDAGVLHHFPTKQELLMAVLHRNTQEQAALMQTMLAPGGVEALRQLGRWGEVMEQSPQWMGLQIALSTEALDPSSPMHEYFTNRYEGLRALLTRLMERAIASGVIRAEIDARHEARAFIAVLDGLRLQWFFDRETSIATEVRAYMDHFIERAVTGDD